MLAFFFRRITSLVLPRFTVAGLVAFIVSFLRVGAILDIDLLLMIGVATVVLLVVVVGEVKVVVEVVDVVPLF